MQIFKNTITLLKGKTGNGKTTLFKCLAGLESYEGVIKNEFSSLSMMFQEPRLLPWLTVKENILLPFKLKKSLLFNKELLCFFVNLTEMSDQLDKYPSFLSGGQKQRASLIRSFIIDSEFFLLDEPFNNLDKKTKSKIVKGLFDYIKKQEKTIIISTHDSNLSIAADNTFLI